jgi:hypothetical protein
MRVALKGLQFSVLRVPQYWGTKASLCCADAPVLEHAGDCRYVAVTIQMFVPSACNSLMGARVLVWQAFALLASRELRPLKPVAVSNAGFPNNSMSSLDCPVYYLLHEAQSKQMTLP